MPSNRKLKKKKEEIYCNLSAWQRVQLSRHPSRPYTLDYINALSGQTFLELHGDRNVMDDKAMVGGLGKLKISLLCLLEHKKDTTPKHANTEILDGKSRRLSKSP